MQPQASCATIQQSPAPEPWFRTRVSAGCSCGTHLNAHRMQDEHNERGFVQNYVPSYNQATVVSTSTTASLSRRRISFSILQEKVLRFPPTLTFRQMHITHPNTCLAPSACSCNIFVKLFLIPNPCTGNKDPTAVILQQRARQQRCLAFGIDQKYLCTPPVSEPSCNFQTPVSCTELRGNTISFTSSPLSSHPNQPFPLYLGPSSRDTCLPQRNLQRTSPQ